MFSVRNFFDLKVKFLSYQTTVRELEDLKKNDWLRKSTLFKSLLSASLLRTFTKRKVCFGETKASLIWSLFVCQFVLDAVFKWLKSTFLAVSRTIEMFAVISLSILVYKYHSRGKDYV